MMFQDILDTSAPKTEFRCLFMPHVWVAVYARSLKLEWYVHLLLLVAKRIGHLYNRTY